MQMVKNRKKSLILVMKTIKECVKKTKKQEKHMNRKRQKEKEDLLKLETNPERKKHLESVAKRCEQLSCSYWLNL